LSRSDSVYRRALKGDASAGSKQAPAAGVAQPAIAHVVTRSESVFRTPGKVQASTWPQETPLVVAVANPSMPMLVPLRSDAMYGSGGDADASVVLQQATSSATAGPWQTPLVVATAAPQVPTFAQPRPDSMYHTRGDPDASVVLRQTSCAVTVTPQPSSLRVPMRGLASPDSRCAVKPTTAPSLGYHPPQRVPYSQASPRMCVEARGSAVTPRGQMDASQRFDYSGRSDALGKSQREQLLQPSVPGIASLRGRAAPPQNIVQGPAHQLYNTMSQAPAGQPEAQLSTPRKQIHVAQARPVQSLGSVNTCDSKQLFTMTPRQNENRNLNLTPRCFDGRESNAQYPAQRSEPTNELLRKSLGTNVIGPTVTAI